MNGRPPVSRDESMAENVAWLLAQNPTAKIVLWAHNGHVARNERWMGGQIAKRVKDEMVVVGFATGRGSYRAVGRTKNGLGEFLLAEPTAKSVEAVFAAAGQPRFLLDLRPARAGGEGNWFADPHDHRSIGATEMTQQFFPMPIARDYDFIAWIEETSPAVGLGR
jgi:erythromycin esterase